MRPLGIPTIWDRIFQQCILQILDPVMEVKFLNPSYGFRPNRSTHHAIARVNAFINRFGLYHCIDDFKILCRNHDTAIKDFHAVSFLKERLHLEISEEKTKIINLRRKSSEFLGFKIRAVKKKKSQHGYVANTNMSEKAKRNVMAKIKEEIKKIQRNPCVKTVWNFNTVVMGIQNYYGIATHITEDLSEIGYHLHKVLYNRLRTLRTKADFSELTPTLQKRYKGYNPQYYKIQDMVFVPIHTQRYKKVMNFSQDICDYTEIGRNKIHKNQKAINSMVLVRLMKNYIPNRNIEYNDNKISKYVAQYGKCAVTGIELGIFNWNCHHIKPVSFGGSDNYQNLKIVSKEIHTIIHMKDMDKIINNPLIQKLTKSQLEKLNKLRMECNRDIIK